MAPLSRSPLLSSTVESVADTLGTDLFGNGGCFLNVTNKAMTTRIAAILNSIVINEIDSSSSHWILPLHP